MCPVGHAVHNSNPARANEKHLPARTPSLSPVLNLSSTGTYITQRCDMYGIDEHMWSRLDDSTDDAFVVQEYNTGDSASTDLTFASSYVAAFLRTMRSAACGKGVFDFLEMFATPECIAGMPKGIPMRATVVHCTPVLHDARIHFAIGAVIEVTSPDFSRVAFCTDELPVPEHRSVYTVTLTVAYTDGRLKVSNANATMDISWSV